MSYYPRRPGWGVLAVVIGVPLFFIALAVFALCAAFGCSTFF